MYLSQLVGIPLPTLLYTTQPRKEMQKNKEKNRCTVYVSVW